MWIGVQAIFNVVPDCATDTSTALLNAFVSSNSTGSTYFVLPFNCTTATPVWQASSNDIQDKLFCGFKQVTYWSNLGLRGYLLHSSSDPLQITNSILCQNLTPQPCMSSMVSEIE